MGKRGVQKKDIPSLFEEVEYDCLGITNLVQPRKKRTTEEICVELDIMEEKQETLDVNYAELVDIIKKQNVMIGNMENDIKVLCKVIIGMYEKKQEKSSVQDLIDIIERSMK